MSVTTNYGLNRFVHAQTALNQLLDTDVVMIDEILYTLSGTIDTQSDHGNLDGLGDDDHTQYILVDGGGWMP